VLFARCIDPGRFLPAGSIGRMIAYGMSNSVRE
jgi:hypothetical protein